MSRLTVPLKSRTLYATGDILLQAILDLELKAGFGSWQHQRFLVDSGSEMTTMSAFIATQLGLPIPKAATLGAKHHQSGLELRSGVLCF